MKNKKITPTLSLLFLVSMTLLAACAGAEAQATPLDQGAAPASSTGVASTPNVLKMDYENALPVAMQLAIGLFKLDESSNPLSAQQAAGLLPLWKAYRSLSQSETFSPMELDAVIVQIQGTLSAEQLEAIAALKLTGDDMAQLAQERDIVLGGPGFGGNTNLTEEQQATREALRALRSQSSSGGGFQGGGPPPGGFIPGSGDPGFVPPNQATPGAIETAMAGRRGSGGGDVSPALVEALIVFLEDKVQ